LDHSSIKLTPGRGLSSPLHQLGQPLPCAPA